MDGNEIHINGACRGCQGPGHARVSCGHWIAGGWLALAVLLVLVGGARAGDITREQAIKAAFIYNFTKFVEWPADCFADENSPFVIGVTESPVFERALKLAVAGHKLKNRPFTVRRIASLEEARSAHVLFFTGEAGPQHDRWLDALKRRPVLTVGEAGPFLKSGGIISLAVEKDKLRFDISQENARSRGLQMSSQLLKLARRVEQ